MTKATGSIRRMRRDTKNTLIILSIIALISVYFAESEGRREMGYDTISEAAARKLRGN